MLGHLFVVSRFVVDQASLGGAPLEANGAVVAIGLDMVGLDVFPETSSVLCGPQATTTLPNVASF